MASRNDCKFSKGGVCHGTGSKLFWSCSAKNKFVERIQCRSELWVEVTQPCSENPVVVDKARGAALRGGGIGVVDDGE
jgi:hypothetical protein